MSQETHPKKRTRFPGIIADARALGVDRKHLWAVLAGTRVSKRLLQQYAALKISQAESKSKNPTI